MTIGAAPASGNPNPNPGSNPPPAAPAGDPPRTGDDAASLRAELERERAERQKAENKAKEHGDALEAARIEKEKQQQNWQKVAQDYEKKYTDVKAEKDGLSKAILVDRKMTAVREAAIKAGLLESALDDLDLVDFPQVTVETTSTGRTHVHGVDSAIQWLKTKKGHWFGGAAPNVNGNSPGVGAPAGNRVSEADIIAAENKARASGDWSEVKALTERFKSQPKQ